MEKMQEMTCFEDDQGSEDPASEDQASEDELEKDKQIDFIDAAKSVGLFAFPQDMSTQDIDKKEAEDLKDILYGLTMISTGHKLVASGSDKIRNVIARIPSLQKLSLLLGSIQSTDPNLLAEANRDSKMPFTSGRCLPKYFKPEGLDGKKFRCKICKEIFGSWTGCDSHIRSMHSHIKYGPCRNCYVFVHCNYDVFRRHEKDCLALKAEKSLK